MRTVAGVVDYLALALGHGHGPGDAGSRQDNRELLAVDLLPILSVLLLLALADNSLLR